MKKVTEKQTFTVFQEKPVDKYETEDGKKFTSEKEAIEHEEQLEKIKVLTKKYKIKTIDAYEYGLEYSDNLLSCKLLYINKLDDETKKDLEFLYSYLKYEVKLFGKIREGYNFFIETEYDSCGISKWSGYNLYIYKLDNIIEEKEKELKKLNLLK